MYVHTHAYTCAYTWTALEIISDLDTILQKAVEVIFFLFQYNHHDSGVVYWMEQEILIIKITKNITITQKHSSYRVVTGHEHPNSKCINCTC